MSMKILIKKIISVVIVLLFGFLISSAGCAHITESEIKLKTHDDGLFKIVHLTDFHAYLAEENSFAITAKPLFALDPSLTDYIDSILEKETPDLVVLGGDNIFCNSGVAEAFYNTSVRTYRAIAEYFEEKNVFWTFVFGNHDPEGGCSKKKIIKAMSRYSRFVGGAEDSENIGSLVIERKEEVFFEGEKLGRKYEKEDRYGNYAIPIYDCEGNSIVYGILTLDTGGYYCPPPQGMAYKTILSEQFVWIDDRMASLTQKAESNINFLIFLHIPYFNDLAETIERMDLIDGIFAGHTHSNYQTSLSVADKSVICAITGCCQENSGENQGTRNARSITIDTASGTITTYCLDEETQKLLN